MAAPDETHVELGFLEKNEPFLLRSRFFPSKFGGKPAWLSLNNLPNVDELSCRVCGNPTTFLLQLYCPDAKKIDAFHRTIFLFVCKKPTCSKPSCSDNFHIFRSQLPKVNQFYSSEPPEERSIEKEIEASLYQTMCIVCGSIGTKICGSCQKVNYCSKIHQRIDWKAGHKQICSKDLKETGMVHEHKFLFPEMEIETEEENHVEENEQKPESNEIDIAKVLDDSQKGVMSNMSESELEQMANRETEADKQLKRFKKRLALEPEQVLRYCKGGEPLWISPGPIPTEIPDCTCGAKRQFEFQILPHMLSHMNVDELGASLDWGVVCVYTCGDSCATGNQYKREYVFKQDIVT